MTSGIAPLDWNQPLTFTTLLGIPGRQNMCPCLLSFTISQIVLVKQIVSKHLGKQYIIQLLRKEPQFILSGHFIGYTCTIYHNSIQQLCHTFCLYKDLNLFLLTYANCLLLRPQLKVVLYLTAFVGRCFKYFVLPIYIHEGDGMLETPLDVMRSSTTPPL